MEPQSIELVCREVVEMVTDYLGGHLGPDDRARFEHHLSACPPCTAYMAQMKTTLDLAAEVGSAAPPAGDAVAQHLGQLFLRWYGERKP
jgi:anti-sigma factor RsiW